MKYIDERVIFNFNDLDVTFNNDMLRYDVMLDDELIFIGNIFAESNPPKIDITDLLRNYFDSNHEFSQTPALSNIFREVTVRLADGENNEYTTLADTILYIYRYPNYNSKVNTPIYDFEFDSSQQTQPMLQGWDYVNNGGYFLPTYPKRDSDVLTFDMTIAKGNVRLNNRFRVVYRNSELEDLSDVIQIDEQSGIYSYSIPMSNLLKGIETDDEFIPICEANYISLTTYANNIQRRITYRIANLDGSSRYFLKWRDRYGMSQIQPFAGTTTYSETFTKTNMSNYQDIKKVSTATIDSKWRLNSGWLSEKYYPFYESIYVSPWLQLYDAKEDKLYDVILTNNEYTEKTFRNQNLNLFNLQLDIELTSKQNIIY